MIAEERAARKALGLHAFAAVDEIKGVAAGVGLRQVLPTDRAEDRHTAIGKRIGDELSPATLRHRSATVATPQTIAMKSPMCGR